MYEWLHIESGDSTLSRYIESVYGGFDTVNILGYQVLYMVSFIQQIYWGI